MKTERQWQETGESRMSDAQRRLREELSYNPETGVFCWKRDGRGKTKRAGMPAGSAHSGSYVRIKVFGATYLAHRLAWFFMRGVWPSDQIDHINRVRSDNRFSNLREATFCENRRNTAGFPSRRIHSRFKGVTRENKSPKWLAHIRANGANMTLGHFDTEQEAAEAYNAAALKYHGEFANGN